MSNMTQIIVVRAPIAEVFAYWRNFENFPRFMANIESVEVTGPDTTHWKAKGALGLTAEWDAVTTYVEENKKIAWKSTDGNIGIHGAVVFNAVGADETKVTVGIEYHTPGGPAGEAFANLFAHPGSRLEEDLKRFKQVVEQGRLEFASGGTSAGGFPFASDHTGGESR